MMIVPSANNLRCTYLFSVMMIDIKATYDAIKVEIRIWALGHNSCAMMPKCQL